MSAELPGGFPLDLANRLWWTKYGPDLAPRPRPSCFGSARPLISRDVALAVEIGRRGPLDGSPDDQTATGGHLAPEGL